MAAARLEWQDETEYIMCARSSRTARGVQVQRVHHRGVHERGYAEGVHAHALGYGVRLRGRKGPADPHGVQQLCAQDLDGLRLGGSARFLYQSPTQVAAQPSVLGVPAAGSLEMVPLPCYWLARGQSGVGLAKNLHWSATLECWQSYWSWVVLNFFRWPLFMKDIKSAAPGQPKLHRLRPAVLGIYSLPAA